MAAFLGDIAFLFGIVVAVAGLFTLHRAVADPRPKLLKIAGIVLLLAGIGTVTCTTLYYFKYHFAGDLEHPYPVMMDGKMMKEMMRERMRGGEPSIDTEEHKEHHNGD